MMGRQWMLWMLVLRVSTSGEAQPGTTGTDSSDGTCHQESLLKAGVRVVTTYGSLTFTTEEGQKTLPLSSVSKEDNGIGDAVKYLKDSTTSSSEAVHTLPKRNMKEISRETLEIENTDDVDVASLRQILGGVERQQLRECYQVLADAAGDRQQLRECYQVLADDAGDRQQVLLQDLLLLHDLPQVVPSNTTQDGLRTVWRSPWCRGSLLLVPQPPLPLFNFTTNSWTEHSSGRTRRSPANVGATYCGNCSLALPLDMTVAADLALVDLVSYLLSLTSGRQFYLVYDDVTPGVVQSFQMLGDTTLLPYDPNIQLLSEMLTSYHHVHAMRNVFILCSVTHLANLFEQVSNKVLESPTIQWFVIVDKDLTKELPLLLREGTQVALVQRLTPQKAQLFSSRVDTDGHIRFHQVGWWPTTGAWPSTRTRLVPDLQRLYSDLQGRQLVVTTNNNWPYFKIKILENGTVIPFSGIDFSVINFLSEKLNFTYLLVSSPDGKWGGPQPDGTITGLVGQVARHEAHAAICEITITGTRETVVDFTMPYFMESTTLVSPAPKEKNRSFAILSPFTVGVWLCICLVTVLMGPVLYLVTRLLVLYLGEEDNVHYSLQSFIFNMYRNLMVQGNLISSLRWSLRFIFFCWYLFSFYIYAIYSGMLTASLAITAYEKPIDSIHELAQAYRDGYIVSTTRDSNYVALFKGAESGIYKKVWQLLNLNDRDQTFLPNPDAGFEMILKHKYVFINAELNSKLKAAQRGQEKFYFARQTFLPQGYGVVCSSGSPFKGIFSRILIRLTEVGLVGKWANDEVNKVSKYMSPPSESGPTAITLQHLQAAFFIMVLGFVISTTVLVTEIMARRCWQSAKTAGIQEVVIHVKARPSQSSQTNGALRFSKKVPDIQIR